MERPRIDLFSFTPKAQKVFIYRIRKRFNQKAMVTFNKTVCFIAAIFAIRPYSSQSGFGGGRFVYGELVYSVEHFAALVAV